MFQFHFSGSRSSRSLVAVFALAAASLISAPTAFADGHGHKSKATKDIVDTAVAAGNFGTLAKALTAAGLVETLKGEGPFTVFAPTDAAFAKLPAGTLDNLLKPENKAQLVAVLTYHVVPGKVMAKDVKAGAVKTVNGKDATLATAGGVTINGAKVVAADLAAGNGVVHVIDTVILP